uniref:Uncharacterized protein n=1 Tax=Plectus sambesii TaxID=2011161 RepID=A0A914W660_9BILA
MDWCPADPDLLVTGGKDHKLFLVNPNTGQFLAEIPYASRNWPHQVSWCDWNPNLIGCASLDGRVTIYSLVGGAESGNASSQQASPAVVPKLADSFPGADFSTFNQTAVAASAAAPIAKPEDTVKLPNVPRWLRPGACGARFGFGGRLVTFGLNKSPDGNAAPSFTVDVKQVVADDKLMNRAMQLQDALDSGQMGDFCEQRAGEAVEEPQQLLWTFLSAQSQGCSRKEYLKILGIDHEKERAHFTEALGQSYTESVEASNLPETANSSEHEDETHSEPAVGPPTPLLLPMDDGSQAGLLMRALIVGDFEAALEVCVNEHQWADAAQISISGGNKLYQKFLKLYEREMQSQQKATSRLIAYLSGDRWNDLINSWELRDWKRLVCVMLSLAPSNRIRALCTRLVNRMLGAPTDVYSPYAAILSVVGSNRIRALCTRLVNRMLGAPTDVYSPYAAILSVVGANVDLLVASLDRHPSTDNVQKIVEQTMALRWIVGGGSARAAASGPQFARLLAKLAQQLVAQGCLDVAWRLLDSVDETTLDDEFVTLKDRLYWACGGQSRTQRTAPKCPFAVEKIGGVAPAAAAAGPGYLRQPQQRDARSWSQSSQYPAAPSHQLHSSPPIAPPQQHVGYVQPRTGLGQDHMSSQMNAPPPVALPNNSMSPGVRGRYPSASNADQILHAAQSMSINQTGYSQSPAYATGMYNGQQPMAPVQPPAMPQTFMPDSNRISSGGPPPASAGYPAAYPDANRGSGPPVAAVAPRPAPVVRQCAPGWNDPPPMEPRKSEPKKAEIPPPVTFGVVGAHAPNAHPPQFGQPQSHHLNGNGYAAPNQMQHNGFGQQAGHSPSSAAQHQHQQQQQQHQPPPEPEPAPIPAEHAVILQTLQHLAQLCASINATPLVRKRTEDASHKIDSELGGRLRQQRLTTSTLENLHHLVRYVQHSDYQSALALHTQMVQGYDFAEISPFMPSLKALLQSGVQLGVRYQ